MKKADKTYILGQSLGLDEAANFLNTEACAYFRLGSNDMFAYKLRELAGKIQKIADERYKHPTVKGD